MAKELQQASSASENISQKFSDETQKSALSIEKSLEKLARYGGFDLLETSIEGVQNINPDRKARRKIFLTEKGKEKTILKDICAVNPVSFHVAFYENVKLCS